jgi:oxygen-dependent protoporphyrinogen oxidase
MMVTAVTFLDRKWPCLRRDDDVVLRAHVGRSDDKRWLEFTDEELTNRVRREVAVLLAKFGEPTGAMVQRWPLGLPQYTIGHESRVQRAQAASANLSVALAGNAYDGVGVPASIGSGRRAAREVQEMLRLTPIG